MVTRKKEVSDKIIIILLILAILFSIGGSLIVYETVHNLRDNTGSPSFKYVSAATGMVTLNVVDNSNVQEGGK